MSPPMPSMTDHSDARLACTTLERSSTYSEPPAQSGSLGSGSLGAPIVAADDHRVVTSRFWIFASASSTARSKPARPSAGSGTYCAMSCYWQTTSCTRESTNGRAMLFGTGVTRPTQWLDSEGVRSGTGRMRRGARPATAAYRCIMSR